MLDSGTHLVHTIPTMNIIIYLDQSQLPKLTQDVHFYSYLTYIQAMVRFVNYETWRHTVLKQSFFMS